jgi:hypothetical protein
LKAKTRRILPGKNNLPPDDPVQLAGCRPRATAQSHFLDLCARLGHDDPVKAAPTAELSLDFYLWRTRMLVAKLTTTSIAEHQ